MCCFCHRYSSWFIVVVGLTQRCVLCRVRAQRSGKNRDRIMPCNLWANTDGANTDGASNDRRCTHSFTKQWPVNIC